MKSIVLATMITAFLAGGAWAACDVELAFTPDTVAAGDEVTMFASIANLGDQDTMADLVISVTFMDYEVGPLEGQMPLAAGEELSNEATFVVPPLPYGGTLTITVTATCDGVSDTATATLTVEADASATGYDGLDEVGRDILAGFDSAPVPDDAASFGELKALYR